MSRKIFYLHDYKMPPKFRQPSRIQRLPSITAGKIRLTCEEAPPGRPGNSLVQITILPRAGDLPLRRLLCGKAEPQGLRQPSANLPSSDLARPRPGLC